jgi:glycosyltransferase involved in cell wall biosynthesis
MAVAISIVIPLYNKAAYVRRSLDSIAQQTFGDFEVLVVNDGSTDGGERIVAEYPDPRFRLINQSNAGPGAARNRGVAEAQADWIAFLDADDEWLPEFLADSLAFAASYGDQVSAVTSGYLEFPAGTSTEPFWRARGIPEGLFRLTSDMPPMQVIHSLAYMCPWSTIVRSSVFRHFGGFFEERCLYAEDAFLWLQVLLNEGVAFQMKPLVRFHREASGLSNNFVRKSPIEPFLTHPDRIEAGCPANLRPLLAQVLAIRAFKRSCVLGYWGQWREAIALRRRYSLPGRWGLPYYGASLLAGTPLAGALGSMWRRLHK